jgi:hypothetical protein
MAEATSVIDVNSDARIIEVVVPTVIGAAVIRRTISGAYADAYAGIAIAGPIVIIGAAGETEAGCGGKDEDGWTGHKQLSQKRSRGEPPRGKRPHAGRDANPNAGGDHKFLIQQQAFAQGIAVSRPQS